MKLPNLTDIAWRFLAPAEPDSNTYLTDGRRLFRVVSRLTPGSVSFFELEDCLTLVVRTYAPADLFHMRLRPVAARPAGTSSRDFDGKLAHAGIGADHDVMAIEGVRNPPTLSAADRRCLPRP